MQPIWEAYVLKQWENLSSTVLRIFPVYNVFAVYTIDGTVTFYKAPCSIDLSKVYFVPPSLGKATGYDWDDLLQYSEPTWSYPCEQLAPMRIKFVMSIRLAQYALRKKWNGSSLYWTHQYDFIDSITDFVWTEIMTDAYSDTDRYFPVTCDGKTTRQCLIGYRNSRGYFFDENRIAHSGKINAAIDSVWSDYIRACRWEALKKTMWKRALARCWRDGMTFKEFLMAYLRVEPSKPYTERKPVTYTEIERFVQKITNPHIERDIDNTNSKSFDFISVDVMLGGIYGDFRATAEKVREYQKEIDKMVCDKIENSPRFTKYGIPVNCLALTSKVICRDFSIHYIFELKKPS